jgi:spoIIIJ-associated protein
MSEEHTENAPSGVELQEGETGPLDEIGDYLERLLALSRLEVSPSLYTERDALVVDFGGPDSELLLDHAGELLDALQVILGKVLPRRFGTTMRVLVDSNHYRVGREREIIEIALRTAGTVASSGKAYELSPMNPHERRMVHLALRDDPHVTTASSGDGEYKRVRILPHHDDT